MSALADDAGDRFPDRVDAVLHEYESGTLESVSSALARVQDDCAQLLAG